jgi:hypothetical protein
MLVTERPNQLPSPLGKDFRNLERYYQLIALTCTLKDSACGAARLFPAQSIYLAVACSGDGSGFDITKRGTRNNAL